MTALSTGGIGADPLALLGDLTGIEFLNDIAPSKLAQDTAFGTENILNDIGLNFIGEGFGEVGKAISGFFGGGKGHAEAVATQRANDNAAIDLNNQLRNAAQTRGINNNINVVDNEQTQAQQSAFLDLLNRIDKTNI